MGLLQPARPQGAVGLQLHRDPRGRGRDVRTGCGPARGHMTAGPGKIGIFGGTFDPIHVGHLVAAVNARNDLNLDRVILMVANSPWQKTGQRSVTPAEDRLAMVEAAVGGVDGLESGRLEIDRGGDSYTADTLASQAQDLRPGEYRIRWQVLASDGHITRGDIPFVVGE